MDKLKTLLFPILANVLGTICMIMLVDIKNDIKALREDNAVNKVEIVNLKDANREIKADIKSLRVQKVWAKHEEGGLTLEKE